MLRCANIYPFTNVRAFLCVYGERRKMVVLERARHKGWCNEVLIILLFTVMKPFLTLIDVSDPIIWHFHTAAGTQLKMSDCPMPPPLPSLSTFGELSLMWLGEHVLYVCTSVGLYDPVSCLQGNSRVVIQVPPSQKIQCLFCTLFFLSFLFLMLFGILVTARHSLCFLCLFNTV